MSEVLLSIQDLHVHYIKRKSVVRAVNGLSIEMSKGETLGLVGETGAGKTTVAKSILRIVPNPPGKIVGGLIEFEGKDVLRMTTAALRKMRGFDASMIFQDPMTSLNPVMTVGEQIAEVIRLHKKISRQEAATEAQVMLETVGIPADRYNDYPHQFSGGMKQRVVIAIALACNPKLLIADEPTTALDVTIQAQVLELMSDLKTRLGTSMLLITHDLGVVAEVCDRVAVIYAGEIVERGTLEEIFDDARHPYTKGLFASLPSLEGDVRRLEPIQGQMPDPTALPTGCAFSPRCPHCMDKCRDDKPQEVTISGSHQVKCHLLCH